MAETALTKSEINKVNKAEKYLFENKFSQARKIFQPILKKHPKDHWLLSRVGTTYYEQMNYSQALKYSLKALKISPDCPLVLWDYAGVLDMLGKEAEAIKIWKGLIKRGIEAIAYDQCGEGIVWSRSLVNDCYYRIGKSYLELGKKVLGQKYIQTHIDNRVQHKYKSIYDLKGVRKQLK